MVNEKSNMVGHRRNDTARVIAVAEWRNDSKSRSPDGSTQERRRAQQLSVFGLERRFPRPGQAQLPVHYGRKGKNGWSADITRSPDLKAIAHPVNIINLVAKSVRRAETEIPQERSVEIRYL